MEQRDHFTKAEFVTSRDDVRRLQRGLSAAGHYHGLFDGRYGPALRTAIESFEAAERRPRTGLASRDLLRRLDVLMAERSGAPAYAPASDRVETGSVPRPQPTRP